jgi:hypothetical protein
MTGGLARWDNVEGMFCVELSDKILSSTFLESGVFVSVSMDFQVLDECISSVLGLCDNLSYCPLSRRLKATSYDYESCLAILMVRILAYGVKI